MPIYSLTKELSDKLKRIILKRKSEKIDPKDMYLQDLNELKKNFKLEN
jgi:hypothetical protein